MLKNLILLILAAGLALSPALSATTQKHYYAHEAVHDKYGVIAPWYKGQNGQIDYRLRIAAETLKRYPWTDDKRSVRALPEYMYSSSWKITEDGKITVPPITDWMNGDLGQRSSYVLSGLVDYYRYTGDPAAIAHINWMADYLIDFCQTPSDHPWPQILVSVPTKGKPYGKTDPKGHIQLDIVSEVGLPLLKAYQLTGNKRWFEAAKHWGDLLAEKRNRESGAAPWGRYANPEDIEWKENKETGGIAFHLYFLDELIRLGYKGKDNSIVQARDAARLYFKDVLLPKWTANDTFGINYWDWPSPVQLENVTEFSCRYMMDNKDFFPNWREDVRNVLSLFLNHTSVDPSSNGDVYSGAWAYPESSGCCGRSLWYGPMEVAWPFAEYGVEAGSDWAYELARRMQILATYDIHDTGYSEDGIDGGPIVNADWFKIAHPMALKHMLATIAWMPELFAPARENHIVRSTSVVTNVTYGVGNIEYSTFDAPEGTYDVLRLAFEPKAVSRLEQADDLNHNGYKVTKLPNGDCLVIVRHDFIKQIRIIGGDPQQRVENVSYKGNWTDLDISGSKNKSCSEAGSEVSAEFTGNQIRLIAGTDANGGLADVYIDGIKQLAGIDFYNPEARRGQTLFYLNGLKNGENGTHTIKIAARGEKNPYSKGTNVYVDCLTYSAAKGETGFGEGGGPTDTQRWIFGYPERKDLVDSLGNKWRPATEYTVRLGQLVDSVEKTWWKDKVTQTVVGTPDPTLYSYGVHAPEFTADFTVGPGKYHVKIKLAATHGIDTRANPMTISINGEPAVKNIDVAATAGGPNKAVDLVFNGIEPKNGAIDIRFTGSNRQDGDCMIRTEAFVQAIEVGPGDFGKGAEPVTVTVDEGLVNLLTNPGFEDGVTGNLGANGNVGGGRGWTYELTSPSQSYIWPESEYNIHPDWGLPEIHCGIQSIRTHSDKDGHTKIYQDVSVLPEKDYTASVWLKTTDLRGKGFGQSPTDSAGLWLFELDESGKVVSDLGKTEVKKAGPYTKLVKQFTTGKNTKKARFMLDTVIACPYNEGHVTYDDCLLVGGKPHDR